MKSGRGRSGSRLRHETSNDRRGARARAHLARQRQRELARRRGTERARLRARTGGGKAPGGRLRGALAFALSLAAGVLLAAPLQSLAASWLGDGLGRLESIAIQGGDHLSHDEIAEATGVAPGSALGGVDPADVERRLSDHPWIREARVMRLPPATLLVHIEERRARALLVGREGTRFVDASGNPFAPAVDELAEGLPRLVGGDALEDGRAHETLREALELLERLPGLAEAGLAPDGRIDLHLPGGNAPEGWRLHAPSTGTRVVLGRGDLAGRFERLWQLLEDEETLRALQEGDDEIDLRFADQAVLRSAVRSGDGGRPGSGGNGTS